MQTLIRYSLAFVWLWTAFCSVVLQPNFGLNLLINAGVQNEFATLVMHGGSVLDALIGIWILLNIAPRACAISQIVVILIYSGLISIIAPQFWLHPFAPVVKNIPMLLLIYIYGFVPNVSQVPEVINNKDIL